MISTGITPLCTVHVEARLPYIGRVSCTMYLCTIVNAEALKNRGGKPGAASKHSYHMSLSAVTYCVNLLRTVDWPDCRGQPINQWPPLALHIQLAGAVHACMDPIIDYLRIPVHRTQHTTHPTHEETGGHQQEQGTATACTCTYEYHCIHRVYCIQCIMVPPYQVSVTVQQKYNYVVLGGRGRWPHE